MDSREGFSKGDRVRLEVESGSSEVVVEGVVNCWATVQYEPAKWYCSVTWGGRYTGQCQANEIRHL
ncbi:hypothetical protein [Streptomyces anulatus]|uniref:hypothetical protein n=1 Tax=Streptomyces anulatus TaxID=1892 RepID=UPI002E10F10E|nr:hypothetical protein OG274_38300 [Streptomyces anulatus]